MNFSIHQASHIGNRKYNQDRVAHAYSSDALLLVLADGMGGHLHGELAAGQAVETFIDAFAQLGGAHIADPGGFISGAMRLAHDSIMKFPHERNKTFPGTTCVSALIQDGNLYWGHAGDSRLYLLRGGAVLDKTRDHSMVHQWVEWGVISDEEARSHPQRNRITNCLGGAEDMFYMEPGGPVALQSGDVLLLGSDGLWNPFTDGELAKAFAAAPVAGALDSLVALALERERGRSDNVTGLAVRWGGAEAAHDTIGPVCRILDVRQL